MQTLLSSADQIVRITDLAGYVHYLIDGDYVLDYQVKADLSDIPENNWHTTLDIGKSYIAKVEVIIR